MSRYTREQLFYGMALLVARRSTCLRLQVGSVIVHKDRVISMGYNGSPRGLPHCTPVTCNEGGPCRATVHAEANAIAFAARSGIAVEGATLYCTHEPCVDCAQLIINSGMAAVAFGATYRKGGSNLLHAAGLQVFGPFEGRYSDA